MQRQHRRMLHDRQLQRAQLRDVRRRALARQRPVLLARLRRLHDVRDVGESTEHRLHVLTTMALSHAALENLSARSDADGRCGIINVSSVAGFEQSPSNISYCATKAWMTSFTNGLAIELAVTKSPVKVQALCPGFTYSEFHDRIGMDRSPIPKQLWLTAEFVAAESLRGFDRGQVIVVPGWRYKIIVAFMRLMPGALLRRISAILGRRYRRPNSKGA